MFPFLTFSQAFVISCLFDNSHPNSVRCYFIIVLIHISLMICDAEHISMFNVVYPLWRNIYSIPLPIKHFFCSWIVEVPYILNVKPLSCWSMVLKYFLSFYRLPFHFVDCFFCSEEGFWFDIIPLVYSCFCCLCFGAICKKSLPRPTSRSFSPFVFF